MNVAIKKTKTQPKKRRTQEQRSATAKAELLNAAISLISQHSYSRVTLQQIASHANMTRGAIQHHFKGREELFISLLTYVENEWAKSFEAVTPEKHIDIEQRIDLLIDNLLAFVQTPAYQAVIDIYMCSRSDKGLRAVSHQAMENSTKRYYKSWTDTFSPEIPTEKITKSRDLATAVLQGLTVTGLFGYDQEILKPSIENSISATKQAIRNIMLEI